MSWHSFSQPTNPVGWGIFFGSHGSIWPIHTLDFIDLPIFLGGAKACVQIRYSQVVFHQNNHKEKHVGTAFYLEMMVVDGIFSI